MTEIDIFSESFVEPQGSNVIVEGQISPTSYALIIKTSPGDCSIYVNDVSDGTNFADNLIGQTSANDPEVACGGASGEQLIDGGSLEYMLPELAGNYTIKAKKDGYQTVIMKYSPQLNLFMQDGFDGMFKYPISICLKREEDKEIEYPVLPVEPDIEYDSPVLNDNIAIGVPIDAFRVLLGTYTFTYGAKDNIAVTTSQVIVDFPVVNRNGTLKQTTGGGDTEYRWDGHIRVNNVHADLDAIKKIEHLGEPVDFYYMNQKKKVLVQSFDYDILDNCNATYRIRVVEYYPQKIKAFPVRIDPLIADRWGYIPQTPPGADDDDPFNKPECKCPLNIVMRGTETRIRGSLIKGTSTKWPTGINPILSQLETLLEDKTTWIQTAFGFGFSNHEIIKRILEYITAFLLNTLDVGSLACLAYLFQQCPEKQEEFFKYIVFEVFAKYTWVEGFDKFLGKKIKYSFMRTNSNGNIEGGNKGSKVLRQEKIFLDLNACVESLLPPYDAYTIGSSIDWHRVLGGVYSCDNFAENYVVYKETCFNATVVLLCKAYHAIQLEPDDFAPRDLTIDEVIKILVDDDWRYHGELVIDGIALELGCMDWCNKNVKEYM